MRDNSIAALATAPLGRYQTLQAGLDLLDQGLSIFDADLRLVAWNRAYERLLDFPEGMAHLGTPFETFIRYNARRGEYGPGDPEALVAERVAAARTFEPHDIERTRPDGRVLHIHGEPLPGHGFVTLYSDVTAQRGAERTIREQNADLENRVAARTAELVSSEQRVRLVMDSIPALVAYFDRRRVYGYLNRVYHDWFRVDTSRPEGVSARAFLGEEVYALVKPNVMRAVAGESVSFEYELGIHTGERRTVRTSLVPERAGDGTVAGCFEFTFDITEQRRSQELIVRAQKLEALGHLTGGLAHDFNNILTVVIGNLAALKEARPNDALVPEYIQPALDAARHGARLVEGLMHFARRRPLQAHAVGVVSVLHSVESLLRHSLPERIRLAVDATGSDAHALSTWIDVGQFEQALINLILNARDAIASEGCIRLRACPASLDADTAATLQTSPGDCVRIDVQDDGAGMDEHTLAHMFEPFFTTKQPGSGTGLGMAMVYGFIKQSGGAIDVRSAPGRGTTISLWLPAAAGAADGRSIAAAQPAASGQRGLALLVDDDAQVRHVVRRDLLGLGYAVLEAGDGAEALALLRQTPDIALLLSDVSMPGGVDGKEVARTARQLHLARAVVLMSGDVAEEWSVPGVPWLSKPFTAAQLATAIEAAHA
ncbi:PAS-domain containing protein [Variovorax sp. J22R24]|uniref:hybrid sensor histidine kinase/response regulator n=1 Tax=Variovorax gracilis TaxID=3053502 RepID=UPI002575EE02|nr:PAS-domain containing protein [Variovorax sp. J22R24]MDM0108978.1 PAS-domain containing protein [Variovorax sp. J22R24]